MADLNTATLKPSESRFLFCRNSYFPRLFSFNNLCLKKDIFKVTLGSFLPVKRISVVRVSVSHYMVSQRLLHPHSYTHFGHGNGEIVMNYT